MRKGEGRKGEERWEKEMGKRKENRVGGKC